MISIALKITEVMSLLSFPFVTVSCNESSLEVDRLAGGALSSFSELQCSRKGVSEDEYVRTRMEVDSLVSGKKSAGDSVVSDEFPPLVVNCSASQSDAYSDITRSINFPSSGSSECMESTTSSKSTPVVAYSDITKRNKSGSRKRQCNLTGDVGEEDDDLQEGIVQSMEEVGRKALLSTSTGSGKARKCKQSGRYRWNKFEERSNGSGKAYSMVKSHAAKKIRDVLQGLGLVQDQAEALQAALGHTSMRVVSEKIGHKKPRDSKTIDFQQF